nr:hypothetical protein [uncultured Acinetobacter sp.]
MEKTNMKNDHAHISQTNLLLSGKLKKMKVSAVAAAITTLICNSVPSYASDAEIYVVPANQTGATTLIMMIDISGSMGRLRGPAQRVSACDLPTGVSASGTGNDNATVSHNGFTTTYRRDYCSSNNTERRYYFRRSSSTPRVYYKCSSTVSPDYSTVNNTTNCSGTSSNKEPTGFTRSGDYYYKDESITTVKYYDRMARMQDAMMAMLNGNANTTKLADDLVIGLSTLGRVGSGNDTGRVVVPARKLNTIVDESNNKTQRDLLIEKVAEFQPISYTPTERAYGEAAAYLLGTNTRHNGTKVTETWGGITATNNPKGSGFAFSETITKNAAGTNYDAPSSITAQVGNTVAARNARECSGQGIYVLTDGEPENAQDINVDKLVLKQALTTATSTSTYTCTGTWNCLHTFAETLKDPTKNPLGIEIRTEVVGFGNDLGSNTNVKDWAIKGGGQGYFTNDANAVVDSVKNFLKDIIKDVPSMSTGASTIPQDALNPEMIQPYAYFPQFEPKINPTETQQLWLGNMKKYYVVGNEVSASASGGAAYTVVKKSKLQDLADAWSTGATYPANTPIYKKGGALSQLILGTTVSGSNTETGRKLFTNYVYDATATTPVSNEFDLVRVPYTYTTDDKTKSDPNAKYLMALLGYNLAESEIVEGVDFRTRTADLRQMGSSPHSLPVLLTQEGQSFAELDSNGKAVLNSRKREDYIMFGTTQGLLTVVEAGTGKEVFSFLPREMLDKQAETFRERGGSLAGGRYALYDGMDGEWTAHTVYVAKDDGTLTVKATTRNVIGSTTEKENLKGKQWVYGGMRMGGRSYYALDLTDINNPKVKFHIDPNSGRVYSADSVDGKAYAALENMGQSWSKPRLDYVNWKGQRKLVMFIGGGYDAGGTDGNGLFDPQGHRTGFAGYEYYNYKQAQANCTVVNDLTCSTGKKGSGVYMFDADNGDLLWYADSNSASATTGVEHLSNSDLKYSVVSEIKTVDRNGDGVVDHLYFGDLAGQAFRVDFKNDSKTFTSQISKVLNVHKSDGTSPRFYLPPTFTAHHSSGKVEGGDIVVAAFVSGNKSSPLLATVDSVASTGSRSSTGLDYDAVYAIYDYDIHPDKSGGYPVLADQLAARTLETSTTAEASLTKLKLIETTVKNSATVTGAKINKDTGWGGWYYPFKKTFANVSAGAAVIKGLTPLIAMDGGLYVTMYDASNAGTSSGCGAGVKGHSFTKKLCLPTGVCKEDADYTWNLGSGIVNLNVGPISGGKSIVVPDRDDICTGPNCKPCVGADCIGKPSFPVVDTQVYFTPKRWYERYAKVE